MKVFLTGRAGCGKSTVLVKTIKLLKEKGLKVGGIVTPEIRSGKRRIGFAVKDVATGKEGILAKTGFDTKKPRIGRYVVEVTGFEMIALAALDFALKECDAIVIDEIGKMEFFSQKFKEKLREVLESTKPIIAVVHRNFVDDFKRYGKVIEVTIENRDKLPDRIVEKISKNSPSFPY